MGASRTFQAHLHYFFHFISRRRSPTIHRCSTSGLSPRGLGARSARIDDRAPYPPSPRVRDWPSPGIGAGEPQRGCVDHYSPGPGRLLLPPAAQFQFRRWKLLGESTTRSSPSFSRIRFRYPDPPRAPPSPPQPEARRPPQSIEPALLDSSFAPFIASHNHVNNSKVRGPRNPWIAAVRELLRATTRTPASLTVIRVTNRSGVQCAGFPLRARTLVLPHRHDSPSHQHHEQACQNLPHRSSSSIPRAARRRLAGVRQACAVHICRVVGQRESADRWAQGSMGRLASGASGGGAFKFASRCGEHATSGMLRIHTAGRQRDSLAPP